MLETCEFSRSCGNALCVALLYSKVSIFQPELREHSFRTILWYLRIVILEPELKRTRGESNPRRRDCGSRQANHETTLKTIRKQRKQDNSHGPAARGQARFPRFDTHDPQRVRRGQSRTAQQRERFDLRDSRRGFAEDKTNSHGATANALRHADLRRGLAELKTNSHGATATALRHAQSPQRVRRGQIRTASSRQSRTAPQRERLDKHDLRRGLAELKTNSHGATARALRHARSAEGSPRSRQIRTAPQRERFDTYDLRRELAELKTNSHGATATALRHARSPALTISAEGSPRSRQVRTAPQRERFDAGDLRRGLAALKTILRGAAARALRHARSLQRGSFVSSRRAYPRQKKKSLQSRREGAREKLACVFRIVK